MTVLDKSFFPDWYHNHGRNFPWREEGVSPFALMITEMLLRQTQAPAVAKLWHDFIQRYPDAETLAHANKDELFARLQILGLGRQRAGALIAAATWLVEHHKGQVPSTKEELLKIPHVGVYVANAILCFVYGYPVEVVDTNILRFYDRYYGLTVKPDIRRNPEIWKLAKLALPSESKEAQRHNYGLLDFTAEVCRSRMPQCDFCPLVASCKFSSQQLTNVRKEQKEDNST